MEDNKSIVPGMTVNQATEQPKPDKQKAIPKWKPLKAEDFNGKPPEEIQPIVQELLYPGLALLGSPPKFGKSYMSLDLAYSVATGQPFLGHQVIRPGQVLYIDLEGTKARTQKRLLSMGTRELPENLEIIYRNSQNEIRTIDNGFLEQMQDWLNDHKNPVLVIVDMWRGVNGRTGRNENEYEASSRTMGLVQNLALQRNISVLLLLHTRKGNSMRTEPDDVFEEFIGSTGQFASADCAWAITGKRTAERKRFSVICRENEKNVIEYEVEFSDFRYHILGTRTEIEASDLRKRYEDNPLVFTIRKLIEKDGGWSGTATDLKNQVINISQTVLSGRKSINTQLEALEFQLKKYDNIVVEYPKSRGGSNRKYTIRKNRPIQQAFI